MKVKCISADSIFLTLGKIYDVYLDKYLQAYIIDDTGKDCLIEYEQHYFKRFQDNTSIKTLRDEFAMAVISGILSELHDCGNDRFDELHKREVRRAYKIADTMMKLRN